jgi:hypothetical protein
MTLFYCRRSQLHLEIDLVRKISPKVPIPLLIQPVRYHQAEKYLEMEPLRLERVQVVHHRNPLMTEPMQSYDQVPGCSSLVNDMIEV